MNIDQLNSLNNDECIEQFTHCCAAHRWVDKMSNARPFSSVQQVKDQAISHWGTMVEADYLEAFDGHPKIGDPASLKAKYASTHAMASNEQSSVNQASDQTIAELAQFNADYESRFGFIFIVCATGKSADEMLGLIKQRIHNTPEQEIRIAAEEQLKILLIRIDKLLT